MANESLVMKTKTTMNDRRRKHASMSTSLEKLANAKKSTYDPRKAKEHERLRMARTVRKYNKLKARQEVHSCSEQEKGDAGNQRRKQTWIEQSRKKDMPKLKRGEVINSKNSEGRSRGDDLLDNPFNDGTEFSQPSKTHTSSRSAIKLAERGDIGEDIHKESHKKHRNKCRKLHLKRNTFGQPLMKFRVQNILEKLTEKN